MLIVDTHSTKNNKISGYERFAKDITPLLLNKENVVGKSYGWGKAARALNFLVTKEFRTDKVLFPTNPPLFWSKAEIKRAIFIVHDIFPIIRPDLCQQITSNVYRKFLEDCIEWGTVLSVSRFTSLEIARHYKIEPPTCIGNIIHINSNLKNRKSSIFKDKIFLLSVGTVEPRKNYKHLIQEYKKFIERTNTNIPLYIFGREGWESKEVISLLRDTPGVCWIENASDEILWEAYAKALFLISTSLYEGFNMPVFEALSLGTECIVPRGSAPTFETKNLVEFDLFDNNLSTILSSSINKRIIKNNKSLIELDNYRPKKIADNIIKAVKLYE